MAGAKETPKPSELGFASLVRSGVAGAVSTHLFGLVVFAEMGEHAGSVCGSEELRYLGSSGLGKIP